MPLRAMVPCTFTAFTHPRERALASPISAHKPYIYVPRRSPRLLRALTPVLPPPPSSPAPPPLRPPGRPTPPARQRHGHPGVDKDAAATAMIGYDSRQYTVRPSLKFHRTAAVNMTRY